MLRIDSVHAPFGAFDKSEPGIGNGVTESDEETNNISAETTSQGDWSWAQILWLIASLGAMVGACFLGLSR